MKRLLFSVLFTSAVFANQNDLVRELFKKSERYKVWQLKNLELSAGKKAQLSWLPLRLETSLYRTRPFYGDKTETATLYGNVKEHADVLNLNLAYNDFSSFTNTFNAQYSRNEYNESYSPLNNARLYDLSNRFEYNVTNSADNSALKIAQGLEILSLSITELQAMKDMNAEYVNFLQKTLTYVLYDCKLKTQIQLKTLVDETLEKGKTLLSINAISRKDFLNYENLQMDLERNIATINNDLLQAKFDAEALGIDLEKNLRRDKLAGICQLNQALPVITSEDFAQNLDFEILQRQMDYNTLQIKDEKRDLVSDIRPFVELGLSSGLNQESKDYRIVAGVSVGWDVPNARMKREVRYREYSKAYTAGDYQLMKKRVEFEAQSLKQDLKYLEQILEITKRNLKSNDDLLKILRLENSLRRGDSLNFFNSVNNRVSMVNNYYDLILQAEVKQAQFALLQDGKYLIK